MSNVVEDAATALDNISASILTTIGDDRTLSEIWGWNQPSITRHEFARLPQRSAERIRTLNEKSISDELRASLSVVPARANWIIANTIPNTPGGNAHLGVLAVREFCTAIEEGLPSPPPPVATVDWRSVENRKQLPPDLLRRLRGVEASLKNIEPRLATAGDDIKLIMDAKSAAEDLPLTMDDISELRKMLDATQDSTGEISKSVSINQSESQAALESMKVHEIEANRVLQNIGAAYRATTTKGLAEAFKNKAMFLNATIAFWIIALAATLTAGGLIAHFNFLEVQKLVSDSKIETERLWVQALLAVIGVGGPIWFAWVATKQIGQRFRMAEDYSYKATIAKAYEGYRLEATRLNPELELRLFTNAMERFEEAPLRLVETSSHGSPIHELMEMPVFMKATALVPELRDAVAGLAGRASGLMASLPLKRETE